MINSRIKLKRIYWEEIERRIEECSPEDLEDHMIHLISIAIEDAYELGRYNRAIKENKILFKEKLKP